MAFTSTGGPGEILEIYPGESSQGIYQRISCNFSPGYTRIPYRADVPGRHYIMFALDDKPSSAIIIDVEGTGSSTITLGTALSATPIQLPGVSQDLNAEGILKEPIDQLNPQPEPPKPKSY